MKTVLGLTGGSGCGKSLAASYLKNHGAYIIDADRIARQVLEVGTPALKEVAATFSDVLLPDGTLNRKKLGSIVFADPSKLAKLNAITHTYIIKEIELLLSNRTESFIVIDAPLLFECGLERLCTACACVLADETVRINRLMSRDGLTEQEAKNRICSQHDDHYFRSRCHFVIENNHDQNALEQELDNLMKELLS